MRSRQYRCLSEEPIDGLEIVADADEPSGDPATLRGLSTAVHIHLTSKFTQGSARSASATARSQDLTELVPPMRKWSAPELRKSITKGDSNEYFENESQSDSQRSWVLTP
jgi:hypothetical protein